MTRISDPSVSCRSIIQARPENGQISASGCKSKALVHIMPMDCLLGRFVEAGSVDNMTMMSEFWVQIYTTSLELIHATLSYRVSSKFDGIVGVCPIKIGRQLGKPSPASLSIGCSMR